MTSNSPTILRESQSISIANGDLQVTFLDNGKPSQIIGGASGLLHRNDASNTSAFNPTCDIGLSFEHIISGHRSQHNLNEARTTPFVVSRLDANSVQMQWKHQDSPWGISSTQKFTVVDPHYIDIDCRFVLENKLVFGNHGYAILFFCNYMNNVEDIALHFRGVEGPNQPESWVRADGPQEHPDWLGGGTYRSLHASDLNYDANHDSKFNCWSYDYPRFTKPFYFGKAGNGMVFMIMFDKLYTEVDEIRFSLFKFDVDNIAKRPAWDFQYVIRRLEEHRTFGFKARVVWKRFVSPDDCLNEYETWVAKNHNASKSRNTSRTRRTIAKHSNKTNP